MEQPAIATPTPDALLRRTDAATALRSAGYPTTKATLATLATRGGGPVYRKFGAIPLYRWSDLQDWAQSKLSAPMQSTSTGDLQAKAA